MLFYFSTECLFVLAMVKAKQPHPEIEQSLPIPFPYNDNGYSICALIFVFWLSNYEITLLIFGLLDTELSN